MSDLFQDMMTGLDEVEAYLAGARSGYRVTLPNTIDVKKIRKQLKMTQSGFSDTFGFSIDAVKHWEGGRRTPESSARAFLTVISRNPHAVLSALHQGPASKRPKRQPMSTQKKPVVARRKSTLTARSMRGQG